MTRTLRSVLGITVLAGFACVDALGTHEVHATPPRGPATVVPPAPSAPVANDGPLMIHVPGGMGVFGEADNPERPPMTARVAGFDLDRTEVTAGAFAECVAGGGCAGYALPREHPGEVITPRYRAWLLASCNFGRPGREHHPMNCVSWQDATRFCQARGARLPTENEWEFAARGPEGRLYPWGNAPVADGTRGNFGDQALRRRFETDDGYTRHFLAFDDGFDATAPVGSFPGGASPTSIQDLAGNVFEWMNDLFRSREPGHSAEGGRVVKGGSWLSRPGTASVSNQDERLVDASIGFRCARDSESP